MLNDRWPVFWSCCWVWCCKLLAHIRPHSLGQHRRLQAYLHAGNPTLQCATPVTTEAVLQGQGFCFGSKLHSLPDSTSATASPASPENSLLRAVSSTTSTSESSAAMAVMSHIEDDCIHSLQSALLCKGYSLVIWQPQLHTGMLLNEAGVANDRQMAKASLCLA